MPDSKSSNTDMNGGDLVFVYNSDRKYHNIIAQLLSITSRLAKIHIELCKDSNGGKFLASLLAAEAVLVMKTLECQEGRGVEKSPDIDPAAAP